MLATEHRSLSVDYGRSPSQSSSSGGSGGSNTAMSSAIVSDSATHVPFVAAQIRCPARNKPLTFRWLVLPQSQKYTTFVFHAQVDRDDWDVTSYSSAGTQRSFSIIYYTLSDYK
jgi:hypothetical protein